MATQQLTLATLAGKSAALVFSLFRTWQISPEPTTVDRFSTALRENRLSPQIVYFCEWVDRWLMGDLIPGPDAVEGRRYQIARFSPEQALAWAAQCGQQFPEQEWLASRLREAARPWASAEPRVVVVVREVLGSSATDEEVSASLPVVPGWLSLF